MRPGATMSSAQMLHGASKMALQSLRSWRRTPAAASGEDHIIA